jgi:hypothetical protein
MVCLLEAWHPGKHATDSIWRNKAFWPTFLAPLMHAFNPHSSIWLKVPYAKKGQLFVILRQVYSNGELRKRLKDLVSARSTLVDKYKQHLRNLIDLFEFLIPAVSVVSLL